MTDRNWKDWYDGWCEAVTDYAVWNDGEQLVGVMRRPLREVLEAKRRELIEQGRLVEVEL